MITVDDTNFGNSIPNPADIALAEELYRRDVDYATHVRHMREVYENSHKSFLTARQREYLEPVRGYPFHVNPLGIVVDVPTERMKIGAILSSDEDTQNFIKSVFEFNRMDAQQQLIHRGAVRDGDSFLIVGWDNDKKLPTLRHEAAWNGSSGMIVRYRPDDRMRIWFAMKRWTVAGRDGNPNTSHLIIYTDDTIYKYYADSSVATWKETSREEWTDSAGRAYGCPVFHFANRPDGSGGGVSEIARLIGMLAAADKSALDLMDVSDRYGMPIYTATGVLLPDDLDLSKDRVLQAQSPSATFGILATGDLEQHIEMLDNWIVKISQMSRIPLNYFQQTGQVSSAASDKSSDAPMLGLIRDRAVGFGNTYEDVVALCIRLANDLDSKKYVNTDIKMKWLSFEVIDIEEADVKKAGIASTKADTYIKLLNTGLPALFAAKLAGYTDEEAARMAKNQPDYGNDGTF